MGEKLRFQFAATTTRLFDIRLNLKWVFAAVDVNSLEEYAIEDYIRLGASSKLWEGARVWGAVKYWGARATGNSEDDLMAYVGFSQRLADGLFHGQVVWGLKGAWRDPNPDDDEEQKNEIDVRHFVAFQLESRF